MAQKLEAAYRAVLAAPAATPDDRERACNNLGVLLVTVGRPADAVKEFARTPNPRLPDAHAYLANYGRALEAAKRPAEALKQYLRSLELKPQNTRATDGAVQVLKGTEKDADRVAGANALFAVTDLPVTTAGAIAYRLLAAWPPGPAANSVLPHLIRYYAAFPVDAERFEEVEKPRLAALATDGAVPGWVTELTAVYEHPERFSPPTALELAKSKERALPDWEKLLPMWEPVLRGESAAGARRDFARVLKVAGDGFRTNAAPEGKLARPDLARQAVGRYLTAHALDRTFPEPPLAAVDTIARFRAQLDSNYQFLNAYADILLDQKEGLKAKLSEPGAKAVVSDYVTLSTLHTVLARLFEAQGKWDDKNDERRGAVFQWQETIKDEAAIRKLNPSYPVSPELRVRLGEARLKSDVGTAKERAVNAVKRFAEAGELYMNTGRAEEAGRLAEVIFVIARKEDLPEAAKMGEQLGRLANRHTLVWEKAADRVPFPVLFPDAKRVVLGDGRSLALWEMGGEKPLSDAPLTGPIAGAANAPVFAALAKPDRIALWSTDKLAQITLLGEHSGGVARLAITPDGRTIASLGLKGGIKIWNDKGTVLQSLDAGVKNPWRIALSPDGRVVFAIGRDGDMSRVAVTDVESKKVTTYAELPKVITTFAVSPSKEHPFVAVGGAAGEVRVYKVGEEKAVKAFRAHARPEAEGPPTAAVTSAQFHPDGKSLVTLGADRTLRVWDYQKEVPVEIARFGHPRQPTGFALSATGDRIAIAFPLPTGGLVRVWDVPRR